MRALAYKQEVTGSSPVSPTRVTRTLNVTHDTDKINLSGIRQGVVVPWAISNCYRRGAR